MFGQDEEQRSDDGGRSWTRRALQQFVAGQLRHRDDIGGNFSNKITKNASLILIDV
jgi:hypothetical protein